MSVERKRKRKKSRRLREAKGALQLVVSLMGITWAAQLAVSGFEYAQGTTDHFLWFNSTRNAAAQDSLATELRVEQAQSVLAELGLAGALPFWDGAAQPIEVSPREWGALASEPIVRAGLPFDGFNMHFAPAGEPLPEGDCLDVDCVEGVRLSQIETVSTHNLTRAQRPGLSVAEQEVRRARDLCYRYLSSDQFRNSFQIASHEPASQNTLFTRRSLEDSTWAICNNIQRYVADVQKLNQKIADLEHMLETHRAAQHAELIFVENDLKWLIAFAQEAYVQRVIGELAQVTAQAAQGQPFYSRDANHLDSWWEEESTFLSDPDNSSEIP